MILPFPFLYLRNWFYKKPVKEVIPDNNYQEVLLEIEKSKATNSQIMEDIRMESFLNREVVNLFFDYESYRIHISQHGIYTIYDENTAKYKTQEAINNYKTEVFNKLKQEAYNKAEDIPLTLEQCNDPNYFTLFTRSEIEKRKNKLKQNI